MPGEAPQGNPENEQGIRSTAESSGVTLPLVSKRGLVTTPIRVKAGPPDLQAGAGGARRGGPSWRAGKAPSTAERNWVTEPLL